MVDEDTVYTDFAKVKGAEIQAGWRIRSPLRKVRTVETIGEPEGWLKNRPVTYADGETNSIVASAEYNAARPVGTGATPTEDAMARVEKKISKVARRYDSQQLERWQKWQVLGFGTAAAALDEGALAEFKKEADRLRKDTRRHSQMPVDAESRLVGALQRGLTQTAGRLDKREAAAFKKANKRRSGVGEVGVGVIF